MKTHVTIIGPNRATSKTLNQRDADALLGNSTFFNGVEIYGVRSIEVKKEIGAMVSLILNFKPDPSRTVSQLLNMAHAADGFIGGWLIAARQAEGQIGYQPENPAVALGRLGGSAKSEAKAKAARENAKRPRPNRRKIKPASSTAPE